MRAYAPPLLVFVISRLGIAALALAAYAAAEPVVKNFHHDLGWAVDLWAQWDGGWYTTIAEDGYVDGESAAFFPLYPGLLAVIGRLLGGHYGLAGVVVSAVTGGLLFIALHDLARRHLDQRGALRTIVYLAIFPTTMFLSAVYSESLFLLLAVGSFVLAERGRFGGAGVGAGLAMLTRLAGIALVPALVILAWRSPDRLRHCRRLAPGLSLALLWPARLALEFGNPLEFVSATSSATSEWHRELNPFGPIGGLATGAWAAVLGAGRLATGEELTGGATMPGSNAAFNVAHFLFVALFALLAIVAWRRFGAAYGVFSVVVVALPLTNPVSGPMPLFSIPRYLMACFPAFMALAWIGRRRWVHVSIVLVSGVVLSATILRWGLSAWVA